jgi:hypothetical protein
VSFGNIFNVSNLTAQNDDECAGGPITNQWDEFPTRHERKAEIDERGFDGIAFDQSERPFRGVRDGRPKFVFGQATIEKRGVVGVVLDDEDIALQSFVLGLTPEPRTEFEQPLNSHLDDFRVVCMVRASNPKESSRKKRLTDVRTLSESFGVSSVERVVELVFRMEEEWISREMAKVMPPELFLRAYGNHKCKIDVAQWMEKEGYHLAIHVDGTKELRRFDEVIARLLKPELKISMSNRHDPFSFSCTPPKVNL